VKDLETFNKIMELVDKVGKIYNGDMGPESMKVFEGLIIPKDVIKRNPSTWESELEDDLIN